MTTRLALGPRTVTRAIAVARRFASGTGLAQDAADRLVVIVEEWLANIVEHGGAQAASLVIMRLERVGHGALVNISDAGVAFDPREIEHKGPNPDRGGGAGIALIRSWSEIEAYERRGGRNRIVLRLKS